MQQPEEADCLACDRRQQGILEDGHPGHRLSPAICQAGCTFGLLLLAREAGPHLVAVYAAKPLVHEGKCLQQQGSTFLLSESDSQHWSQVSGQARTASRTLVYMGPHSRRT